MKNKRRGLSVCVALLCLAVGVAYGVGAGEQAKIQGLITARTGGTLVVKTMEGTTTVALTDDTKVQQPKGLGARKKRMSASVLIPGLRVTVEGVGDAQNRLVASTITFSGNDLKTAQSNQAGLNPTQLEVQAAQQNIETNKEGIQSNQQQIAADQQKIAANQQEIHDVNKRFSELTDYDVKGEATVYFKVGSTAISPQDRAALKKLAHDAVNLTGYFIQVKGFADSSGNAAMNQKLSMDRAEAVVAYLLQEGNVPMRHDSAPGAMGTAAPAAPNETKAGRTENRRVEVKVLVNRGLAGE